MKPWPDNAFLQGYYEPLTFEADAPDLVIEGEIPKDLNGTFFRNGPNPQFPPEREYHFFTGDSMVHAFHFDNGKVSHRNRWARTARFDIEQRLGGSYFSGMNPMETDPRLLEFVINDKEGVANTSIVWHGGRLLLLEEGHLPFSMDPQTLASYGAWDFYGKLNTRMTAHPKVDPVTGEMIFFCYMAEGFFDDGVGLYKVDRDGFLTEAHQFKAPYCSMLHDFVVTENYIIFPVLPLTGSLDRAMSGQPSFAWEPDKPGYLGVMPRTGTPEDIQWIETEACYVFHHLNGFDRDGVITIESCHFDAPPLFPLVDGSATGIIHPRVNRWVIDMNGDQPRASKEYIGDNGAEFPVIDPRYAMREYTHAWYTSTDRSIPAPIPDSDWVYNSIEHFNVKTGEVDRYDFPNSHVAEPMFVPKSDSAAEGEGYVLDVVYNYDTNMSDMCVFDAQNISAGPIGKAKVSHRVPVSFHGTWMPTSAN
jgi:carotenoid cleavage dioxygenase